MAGHDPAAAHELGLHLLVLRCQAGDERAFAQLMDRFGKRTMSYLRGLVGDDADDVQQQVWLTVYRSVSTLSNPGAFRTWLFRTTRHRALDFLRKQRREQELVDEAGAELVEVTEAADESRPLLDGAELDGALAALPPAQREVLLLRYQDDLSYAEVALVVGCSIGTVRSRLHHAKRKLHDSIQHRR
jgi:RNA polymerase sigma-70 factor (ECF subfamily)